MGIADVHCITFFTVSVIVSADAILVFCAAARMAKTFPDASPLTAMTRMTKADCAKECAVAYTCETKEAGQEEQFSLMQLQPTFWSYFRDATCYVILL